LGRGCEARDDTKAPHSQDPGGAGRRPTTALLLAWVQAPRAHGWVSARHRTRTPPGQAYGSNGGGHVAAPDAHFYEVCRSASGEPELTTRHGRRARPQSSASARHQPPFFGPELRVGRMLGSSGTAWVRPVPGKGGTRRPGAFLRGAAASSESSSRSAASMEASIASRWPVRSMGARLMRVPDVSCSASSAGVLPGRPLRRGAALWRLTLTGITKIRNDLRSAALSTLHSHFRSVSTLSTKRAACSASPLVAAANRSRFSVRGQRNDHLGPRAPTPLRSKRALRQLTKERKDRVRRPGWLLLARGLMFLS
jgi:hypothetical protein